MKRDARTGQKSCKAVDILWQLARYSFGDTPAGRRNVSVLNAKASESFQSAHGAILIPQLSVPMFFKSIARVMTSIVPMTRSLTRISIY